MGFDELWDELEDHPTDEQIRYIETLLEQTRQTDEQCRYWKNRLEDADFYDAQKIIEELRAINILLDHPRFGGGAISHKEGIKQGKEMMGE